MQDGAGIAAAFNGSVSKPSYMSAMILTTDSSFGNWVGINWAEYPAGTFPLGLDTPPILHTLSSWALYAPSDSTFGSTAYVIQGSNLAGGFATWTTLSAGNTAGAVGEVITGTAAVGAPYQFHRAAFWGGAGLPIAIAQVQFSVSDTATVTSS
jgi:hypothetical protein